MLAAGPRKRLELLQIHREQQRRKKSNNGKNKYLPWKTEDLAVPGTECRVREKGSFIIILGRFILKRKIDSKYFTIVAAS